MADANHYDLMILGGGPAGAAAAIRAASDLRVLLIDSATFPRSRPCGGWIGPAGVELVESLGVSESEVGAARFSGLSLHSWDLRKHSEVKHSELHGWLVDRAAFDAALLRRAGKLGVTVRTGTAWREIHLRDDLVQVRLDDGIVSAAVLCIADGYGSPGARAARMIAAGQRPGAASSVLLNLPPAAKATPRLDVILGSQRSGLLATLSRAPHGTSFAMLSRLDAAGTREHYDNLISAAQAAELLPATLPNPQLLHTPAGTALDLETHVGKRCLLIGEAGGFVAAFSNEGIHPSMRSGVLAAETALRAIRAPMLQDELATFDSTWRTQMSDCLRMPNTDLALLVPLVFGNAQMSLRVARAFLLGQPF